MSTPGARRTLGNATCITMRPIGVTMSPGTTSFSFAAVGSTVRMTPATGAWTGATSSTIEPEPGVDGRAFVVYKVTGPVAGVWHYEYAIHNQNLDRSIQSFSVPLGCGITVSNVGFHAPPNHPGFPNDGTVGNAGFSNAAWTSNQTLDDLSWNTETFAQNQNANAIRFGTMYNFRFDSDRPPQAANATIGFFKTGTPITVAIQGPSPDVCTSTPSPTATATATATGTPIPSPSATVSPSPTPANRDAHHNTGRDCYPTTTPGGTASPTSTPARALNLSTRLLVQTGANVGIGGFIVTGSAPKQVLLRGIGPSLTGFGVPDALADPVMELHGPAGFTTITNDNWRDTQEAEIQATGIPPTNDLESAILATLPPGAYTAIVSGKNNTSGVGLVEVYDLDPVPSSNSATSARAPSSARPTSHDRWIHPWRRAVCTRSSYEDSGPAWCIACPIRWPIRPWNSATATELLLASNDNWQDDPAGRSSPGLAHRRHGLIARIPPGVYTAVLAGADGGTGVGLVEVYNLGSGGPITTPTPGTPSPTATATATSTPGGASPTPTATATAAATRDVRRDRVWRASME